MLRVVGPADAAEVGHPARDGDVAQIAAAVNENGLGKQRRQKAEIHVVVRHLVDDPLGVAAVELRQPLQMLPGDAQRGRGVKVGHAIAWQFGKAHRGGQCFERLPHQAQLAGAVDPRVAGEHLFGERRARTRQAEDEHRPPRRRTRPGEPLEKVAIELPHEHVDELLVVGGRILAAVAVQFQRQGIGLPQAVRGPGEIAPGVERLGQGV